ncbi:MAG: porin family protein [Ignavibacteria bacterium]|nr:porin family protein [Ignavibacteria bacterium]
MKKALFFAIFVLFLISTSFYSFAQRGKKVQYSPIMLGAEIGLGIPTGDFGDVVNTGYGLNGVFSYFLQSDLLLTGTIGYWSFKKEEGGVDFTFNTIPFNAGIQYRFGQVQFIPFIGAETFLFFNSAKVSYLGYSESDSETKFGFVPLVGFAYKISPTMELRGTFKYTIIFTEGENTTFIGILFGLHFPL